MSKFIIGTNRPERKRTGEANQLPLFASSIDDAIAQDNEIRLIDLFVDTLKLPDFGFAFSSFNRSFKAFFKLQIINNQL